jgi:hypothetical protein
LIQPIQRYNNLSHCFKLPSTARSLVMAVILLSARPPEKFPLPKRS